MSSQNKMCFVPRASCLVNCFLQGTRHKAQITAILLAGLLSACGFQPMYGEKSMGDGSKINAGVKIDGISGRSGQELRTGLEDRLNPPGGVPSSPAYRLSANLSYTSAPIGVARDGTVSTYNVYLLYRTTDDQPVTTGTLSYVGSYNNLVNAYFSTYVAEEDAVKRGVTELSELYRQRLGAYLDAGAPVQAVKPSDLAAPTTAPLNPWQTNPLQPASPLSAPKL